MKISHNLLPVFDVSAATTMTKTHAGSAWQTASGDSMNNLIQTKLSVSKGLPGGWDVGGFVSKAPSTNVSVAGVQVKYASARRQCHHARHCRARQPQPHGRCVWHRAFLNLITQ